MPEQRLPHRAFRPIAPNDIIRLEPLLPCPRRRSNIHIRPRDAPRLILPHANNTVLEPHLHQARKPLLTMAEHDLHQLPQRNNRHAVRVPRHGVQVHLDEPLVICDAPPRDGRVGRDGRRADVVEDARAPEHAGGRDAVLRRA